MRSPKEYVAVIIAVDRKVTTATKDRMERRGSPHKPCPLVQPFDSSVPAPTRAPATTSLVLELAKLNSKLSKGMRRMDLYSKSVLSRAEEKMIPRTTIAFVFVASPKWRSAYSRET